MIAPVKSKCREDNFDDFLNGMSLSGGDDKILRLVQAKDAIHCVDIIGCVSPIDPSREVAEVEFVRGSARNGDGRVDDFWNHKFALAQRRLVIEENA